MQRVATAVLTIRFLHTFLCLKSKHTQPLQHCNGAKTGWVHWLHLHPLLVSLFFWLFACGFLLLLLFWLLFFSFSFGRLT